MIAGYGYEIVLQEKMYLDEPYAIQRVSGLVGRVPLLVFT